MKALGLKKKRFCIVQDISTETDRQQTTLWKQYIPHNLVDGSIMSKSFNLNNNEEQHHNNDQVHISQNEKVDWRNEILQYWDPRNIHLQFQHVLKLPFSSVLCIVGIADFLIPLLQQKKVITMIKINNIKFQTYKGWIYNYLCNECLSTPTLQIWILLRRDVLDTTLCDKTDRHDITEILLKVALNTITPQFYN